MKKCIKRIFFGQSQILLINCLCICVLMLTLVSGCTKQEIAEEKVVEGKKTSKQTELAIGLPDQITSLDPLETKNPWELQLVDNLYEGLVGYNSDTKTVESALAKEWSEDPSGLAFTFTLRDSAVFHSGKMVTAYDIKASWERAIKKASGETWHIFNNISGFEQFSTGKATEVTGLVVLDDKNIQVALNIPDETFLLKLTHPYAAIVDVEYIQAPGLSYGVEGTIDAPTRVNGTGPYALVEWAAHQNITLEAFKEHPLKDKFARVEFHLNKEADIAVAELQRGSVDILRMSQKIPDIVLARDPNLHESKINQPRGEIYYLGFNLLKEPFTEQSLRQAINLAINRKQLGDKETEREAKGLLPRAIIEGRNPITPYDFDQEAAKRLLSYSALNSDSKQKTLNLYYVSEGNAEKLAKKVAEDLGKIGLDVRTQALNSYQELNNGIGAGSVSFYLNKWIGQAEEVGFLLKPLFFSTSPYNTARYNNGAVDELLRLIQTQKPFSKEYKDAVLEAEKMIMQENPIITLLEKEDSVYTNELVGEMSLHPILGVELQKVKLRTE